MLYQIAIFCTTYFLISVLLYSILVIASGKLEDIEDLQGYIGLLLLCFIWPISLTIFICYLFIKSLYKLYNYGRRKIIRSI